MVLSGDVDQQRAVPGQVTTQPCGALLGVRGWRRQPRQRATQYTAGARVSLPGARAISDLTMGARPANAAAQASTA